MGKKRNVYWNFVEQPEGKEPLERPRHRQQYTIKVDLKIIGWEGVDWIDLTQDMSSGPLL
jgi:hypothetical protein